MSDSESEPGAKQRLRELDELRRARIVEKTLAKQEKRERRIPGLRPKAGGDLGAVDEREEDWEKYKEEGGQKDHEQFCRDSMVAGFEAHLKKELKLKL